MSKALRTMVPSSSSQKGSKGSKYSDKPEGSVEPRRLKSEVLVMCSHCCFTPPAQFLTFNHLASSVARILATSRSPTLAAFQLMLIIHASCAAAHRSGKNAYYFDSDKGVELYFPSANHVEVLHGFFASLYPVSNRLMVNIDSCASTFFVPQARLSIAIIEYAHKSNGIQYSIELYDKIKITATYLGYRKQYKVKRIGPDSIARVTVYVKERNSQ